MSQHSTLQCALLNKVVNLAGFSELSSVLTFAIIAIGLDDAFILAHAQHRELEAVFSAPDGRTKSAEEVVEAIMMVMQSP